MTGVHIETVAVCLDCDWQAAGVRADAAAAKHTRETTHGTVTSTPGVSDV